jgi:hypothetical protein
MIRALGRAVRAGLAVVPLVGAALRAQERPAEPPRIADNSFLVEEAYNQEAGVVQHIGTFRRAPDGAWLFAFTQEWPAPSQRHQLSYTAPVVSNGPGGTGVGDLAINYRYQAAGHDDARVWFAPRLSLILPTGDAATGRGFGGPGMQTNLPLSVELTPTLVTHWNAGIAATRARDLDGVRRTLRSFAAAASAIWLAAPTLNLMLESVWERTEAFDSPDALRTDGRFTLMPGVRGAINLSSGMQVVPGVGMPFVRSGGRTEHDLFLYLSVEHSFR